MLWLSNLRNEQLREKRVLLRLDLNVPFELGEIRDDFRIKRIIPTVKRLLDTRAQVIVLSHRGEKEASVAPVADYLKQFFPTIFAVDFSAIPARDAWPYGTVIVLENLRFEPGEKNNDPEFAKKLAAQGDIYINDAFSASHREHASIVGLPKLLPSYGGLSLAEEITQLSQLFSPREPLMVIIGGAKFNTKLPLVRRFLNVADKIFIAGALAHPFFKLLGYEIGQSLYDNVTSDLSDLVNNPKVILPAEVLVKQGSRLGVTTPDKVPADGVIVDAGPAALGQLAEMVTDAQTVLWNGPLGNYEQGFVDPTRDLAKLIASHQAHAVVGGGDTIAAIEELKLFDKFGFVSTGGGAMLDFLAEGTLPGIKALEESEKNLKVSL